MQSFSTVLGIVILVVVLLDAFETTILPRRVRRGFRITSWFYRYTWRPWWTLAKLIRSKTRRETFLGYFGPLSLLFLLMIWAFGLILAFALLHWSAGEHVRLGGERVHFWTVLYLSGSTFFTIGFGDVLPISGIERFLAVLEGGMGFAFLGVVIGYLPTIYSAFSKREIQISLLDARAGSPPTSAELLLRVGKYPQDAGLDAILRDWEHWAAEVLESHISYPMLSYFRSQHSNQSWLGALTMILDSSALVIAGIDDIRPEQAKLTFAMARHAVVDLTQILNVRYQPPQTDRLSSEELSTLREKLAEKGVRVRNDAAFEQKLAALRTQYEPYAQAIASQLFITLPPWHHNERKKDNWQAGPWDRIIQAKGLGRISARTAKGDDHF
jgi:ion channel